MAANYAKTVLVQMKLIDEAGSIIIANYGQGLISVDDFAHLKDKYVEGLSQVLRRTGGTTGGSANLGDAVSAMDEANLQVIVY